jgi:hypothetical protein
MLIESIGNNIHNNIFENPSDQKDGKLPETINSDQFYPISV